MSSTISFHAASRAQERGIPPLIQTWLLDYGDELFDGNGGIVRFFSTQSRRRLERSVGREPLRRLSEYMQSYLVESSKDGQVITMGKRYARINRP